MTIFHSINDVQRAILSKNARKIPGHQQMSNAAVAIIFKKKPTDSLEILFIQRAIKKGDPWSGHMAFPGGHEEENESLKETAIRETFEELHVRLNKAQFLGRGSQHIARANGKILPLVVTPFFYFVDNPIHPIPNHEVANIVWIPLAFLVDKNNRSTFLYRLKTIPLSLSCIYYENYKIWGLTLQMLDDFVGRLVSVT